MIKYQEITLEILDNALEEIKKSTDAEIRFHKHNLEDNFYCTNKSIDYFNYKVKFITLLNTCEIELTTIQRTLHEYYKCNCEINLSKSSDLKLYIEADVKYIEVKQIYNKLKLIIDYLDHVLDVIKTKHFEMKLWLDYQKYKNGDY